MLTLASAQAYAVDPWIINTPIVVQANGVNYFNGSVTGNVVHLMAGGSAPSLYAAFSAGAQTHSSNILNISGGSVSGFSAAGSAVNPAAAVLGNSVLMTGGAIGSDLFGGRGSGGLLDDNSVVMTGGNVTGTVYGAFNATGTVTNNSVSVQGSAVVVRDVYGGRLGGTGAGLVSNNSVTLDDSATINGNIFGGVGVNQESSSNSVTVSGGVVQAGVFGGSSSSGKVSDNTVTVSDGKVNQSVTAGASALGNALIVKNKVSIIGDGQVGTDVYGGSARGTGESRENSVTISGNARVGRTIYGGLTLRALER